MYYAPKSRGYYAIGSECFSYNCNLGTLYRSAYAMGAQYIFSMNKKPNLRGDVPKSYKHIPYFHYDSTDEFIKTRPKSSVLIGVEINDSAHTLYNFVHPERAIYVLGNETVGLSDKIMSHIDCCIYIPSQFCLNVSVAGSIIMYDRQRKAQK